MRYTCIPAIDTDATMSPISPNEHSSCVPGKIGVPGQTWETTAFVGSGLLFINTEFECLDKCSISYVQWIEEIEEIELYGMWFRLEVLQGSSTARQRLTVRGQHGWHHVVLHCTATANTSLPTLTESGRLRRSHYCCTVRQG